MPRKIEFIPFARPDKNITVTEVPKGATILKATTRLIESALVRQGTLEFGLLVIADMQATKERRKFMLVLPGQEVPDKATLLPGEVPMPGGMISFPFELPLFDS